MGSYKKRREKEWGKKWEEMRREEWGLREWEWGWVMGWRRGRHSTSWHLLSLGLFPPLCLLLSYFSALPLPSLGSCLPLHSFALTFPVFLLFFSQICHLVFFYSIVTLEQAATQPYKVLLHHMHVDRQSSEVFPLLECNQTPLHIAVRRTHTHTQILFLIHVRYAIYLI